MRKYIMAFIGFAIAAILITIICLVSFKPIDLLMKPPMSDGENLDIQHAFEEYVDSSYRLRVPLKGDYRSAFIFEDIDSDRQDEVFVFYSTDDSLETVRMSYLVKDDGGWKVAADYESLYNEIQKIDFADLNNDGIMEIFVGWAIYQNDLSQNLNVYKLKNGTENTIEDLYSCPYTEFEIVDIDGDSVTDFALFDRNDSTGCYRLSYKTYKKDEIVTVDETDLDASVYSVIGIVCDQPTKNSPMRMYIDGYKIDSGVVTECIFWNKKKKTLNKFESEEKITILSSRMTNLRCKDINNDGLIEIPVELQLKNSKVLTLNKTEPQTQHIISWIQLTADGPTEVTKQLVYNNNDFSITFSDSWFENVTVTNDYTENVIYFYSDIYGDDTRLLFELKYTSNQEEEDNLSDKYKFLTETGKGKIFYIIYNYDRNLNINRTYIENSIVYQ